MRTGRHTSKKRKPDHAYWMGLGRTNNYGCSRHWLSWIPLHPHNNSLVIGTNTNTAVEKSSQDTNNWQVWNDEGAKLCDFLQGSVHKHPHFWQRCNCNQFTQMLTAPLKMFHMTEWRMFPNKVSVSLWSSTSCLVIMWSNVQGEKNTVWWGTFTNHKLQLYVQIVYKSQSGNSMSTIERE